MGTSETRRLTGLTSPRRAFIDGKIAEHNGRAPKLTGDGILVEFSSIVNAAANGSTIHLQIAEL
jgi:adenylate cyclase